MSLSVRPTISFSGETFTDVEMPTLALHAIRDNSGKGFLLLAGSEPDLRWEQFVDAVRRLSDGLGVTDVIGLNAIPMAVPHTRPPSITAHGSDPDALGDLPRWGSAMKLPASASMLLELRMGEHDYRASGLSVHVPHYLAQTNYPAASARLACHLRHVHFEPHRFRSDRHRPPLSPEPFDHMHLRTAASPTPQRLAGRCDPHDHLSPLVPRRHVPVASNTEPVIQQTRGHAGFSVSGIV